MFKNFQNSFSARSTQATPSLRTSRTPTQSPVKSRSKGFTLIEIMIALAIMGIAIAAVLYYQGKAEGSQKALATVQDTTSLASKIKAMYGPQNTYTSITAADLEKMGIVPSGFTVTSGVIYDAYGNVMTFTGGPSTFTISVGGDTGPLQNEECAAIATGIRGNAMAVMVGSDAAGAAGIATGGSAYKELNGKLHADNLASGCDGDSPKVVMQFR